MASDEQKLLPLRPKADSGAYLVWRLVPPQAEESCRWETADRRWIAIRLGDGDEVGQVIVASSDGRRERVDSYEGALELAKLWRQ